MNLISVNDAVYSSDSLFGTEVFLHGILTCSEENVLIEHWPKSERIPKSYNQAWVNTGEGAFGFNDRVLSQISDKRVVVRGTLLANRAVWPDDPGSFWAVHLLATELAEFKIWNAEHGNG
jgi:hypothetical protein